MLPNRNSRVHAFIGKRYDGSHWDCRCRSSVFFSTSLGYNELRRRVQRKAVGQLLECSGCNLVDINIDDDDAPRHCVESCIPVCSSYHALSARTVVLHKFGQWCRFKGLYTLSVFHVPCTSYRQCDVGLSSPSFVNGFPRDGSVPICMNKKQVSWWQVDLASFRSILPSAGFSRRMWNHKLIVVP